VKGGESAGERGGFRTVVESGRGSHGLLMIVPFRPSGALGLFWRPTCSIATIRTRGLEPRAVMISSPRRALDQFREMPLSERDSDCRHCLLNSTSEKNFSVYPPTHPFALIICSACLREVSVSLAPLNMRATSSVRSSPDTARILVRVRPPDSFFSIT
jgi:hypothetical protein